MTPFFFPFFSHLALASAGQKTEAVRHCFPSDRETFKFLASQSALDLLRRRLLG